MSEWNNMSTRRLWLQGASTIKIQRNVLVLYKADIINISSIVNCSHNEIAEKNCSFGIKQQSLTHRLWTESVRSYDFVS